MNGPQDKARHGRSYSIWRADADWAHKGYDQGGSLPGGTPTANATGRPEAILTESQWATVRSALDLQ